MREKRKTLLVIILLVGIVLSGTVVFALNDVPLLSVANEPDAVSSITPVEAHDLLSGSGAVENTLDTNIADLNSGNIEDVDGGNITPDITGENPVADDGVTVNDNTLDNEQTNIADETGSNSDPVGEVLSGTEVNNSQGNDNNNPGQTGQVAQNPEVPSQSESSGQKESSDSDTPANLPTPSVLPSVSDNSETETSPGVETSVGNQVSAGIDYSSESEASSPQQNTGTGTSLNSDNTVGNSSETISDAVGEAKQENNASTIVSPSNGEDTQNNSGGNDSVDNAAAAGKTTDNGGKSPLDSDSQTKPETQKDSIKVDADVQPTPNGDETPAVKPSEKAPEVVSSPTNSLNASFIEDKNTPGSGAAAPTPQAPIIAAVQAAQPEVSPDSGNVKILITDMENEPINGARIQIPKLGIVTDTEGIASASLPPGVYTYVIKAKGYKNLTGKLTVTDDGAVDLHFYLKKNVMPAATANPNAFYAAILQFADASGGYTPASNVRVTIGGNVYYTNVLGTVVLSNLSPGTYTVSIGGENYYETQYTLTINDNNVYQVIDVANYNNINQYGGYFNPPTYTGFQNTVYSSADSGTINAVPEAQSVPYLLQQPSPVPEQNITAEPESNARQNSVNRPNSESTNKSTATKKPSAQSTKPAASAVSSPKKSVEPKPTTLNTTAPSAKPTEDTEIVAPKNSIKPMASLTVPPSEIPSPEPSHAPDLTATSTPQSKLFNIGFNITDLDGAALSNKEVELHSDVMKAKTDSDGYVLFKDVPEGEHNLYIMDELGEIEVSKAFTLTDGVKTELDISSVGGDKIFAGMGTDNLTVDAVVDGKLMALTTVEEGLNPKAAPEKSNGVSRAEDNNLMWMLIVSVAAAVIAVVVLMVAIRRMKKSKTIDIRSAEPVGDTIAIAGKRKKGIKLFK